MIEVKNLNKSFGNAHILKGIDAKFHEAKTNLIIGQSGSGKSVFIKCLLGLYKYEEGSIEYNGEIFANLTESKKRDMRAKIGMVFQGSALFDSLTIEENVMFPLRMFTKLKKDEMRDRANIVLKRVNLENAHNKMPSEASGGMQKRVAIARAIVNNPKYLFCDEPNSGLDPKTAIVIDNLIHEITEEYKITTVINTHDMNSVMEIGDNIMFLRNGLKAWEGTKDTIFRTDNEVVTDFVYSSNLFKKVREAILRENS
ncbi:ATP-binding cassette domain-containing protein [Lacinutrix sp.]|uniref:ABC transporter ATP-binding protein n=1 Tax=Lacinutrix sp. TaxID=1937692 RepID=UPI0025C3E93B|nr:ATP-binding cassette domain-containing protein [Lacinutrix sp.]